MSDQKITLTTVADLIAECPQDAPVMLFSDAEGNACNPLDYVGIDDEKVVLVPMHRGWERYR
jgi:hypothetical protein